MESSIKQLEDRLVDVITPHGSMLTAYSGGVDSTLVAVMARRVLGRDHAPAVIGDSASVPRSELSEARALADRLDFELIEAAPGEQQDAAYLANNPDRCFHCKTHLYGALREVAEERGITTIANGANVDDRGDYRPGMQAASNADVISPLIDAGLDKPQIRALASHLGLPNADKPAAACLASRIPYGTTVTPQRLTMVERAEAVLAGLGFSGFRVRHHETVARLEIPLDQIDRLGTREIRENLVSSVKAIGFTYVALDLEGFRSGSGNVILGESSAPMG
ncbi:MAG: ATP-dependent sacrificial sulfur transferase LarE [Planctomycetota bacterium]